MSDIKENEWKAREDARILAQALTIMDDQDRLKKARQAAKALLKEQTERAEEEESQREALIRISGKGKMGSYSKKFNELYE